MGAAEAIRLSYADYLALERETGLRYEFLDGEAWLMGGGTPRHSKVKVNLTMTLAAALGDGPCQAYDSDLKVRTVATGLSTYPDLTVIGGQLERHPDDHNAVTNPTLIAEVLSPSTERWDRRGKFNNFQRIGSLKHYVLVHPEEPWVEVFSRGEGDLWNYRAFVGGDAMPLPAIGVTLEVDALYRNLPED